MNPGWREGRFQRIPPADDLQIRMKNDAAQAGIQDAAAKIRVRLGAVIAGIETAEPPENIRADQQEGSGSRIHRHGHLHIVIGKGVGLIPLAEDAAEAVEHGAQHGTDGKLPAGEEQFLALLGEKAGREDGDVGMGIHIHDHLAQEARMKGYIRIQQEMIAALEMGQDRVMRAGKAHVLLLGQNNQPREGPFQPLRRHLLRRVVAEKDGHLQIRILNAAEGVIHLVPAAAYYKTGGKDRRHEEEPPFPAVSVICSPYFTGKRGLCKGKRRLWKESHWQKALFDDILGRYGGKAADLKGKKVLKLSKFAVFVDLENCGAKVPTLKSILEKVKIRGDILLGKVYGYTDKFDDLKEVLLSNTFTVVPSLRYGISQKNNADIQLVIDALQVAYENELIDSFCIVSGDSDYVPLVGRLKSMGKFVLGISRSEAASNIFINACNEFQFLESVGKRNVEKPRKQKTGITNEEMADESELNKLLTTVLEEQTDRDEIYASELKGTLLRLRPDFNEKAYGCATFYKLLMKLANRFGDLRVHNDNFDVMVGLSNSGDNTEAIPQLTRENWKEAFAAQIKAYKEGGFERVNPSILKADIITAYPDFNERAIGFKRFSDVMKQLEKDGLVIVEMDEQNTMLIKLL